MLTGQYPGAVNCLGLTVYIQLALPHEPAQLGELVVGVDGLHLGINRAGTEAGLPGWGHGRGRKSGVEENASGFVDGWLKLGSNWLYLESGKEQPGRGKQHGRGRSSESKEKV